MRVPEVGRDQRAQGDGQQDSHEGNDGPQGKQSHRAGMDGAVPVTVILAMPVTVFGGMGIGVFPGGVFTVSGPVILGHGERGGETEKTRGHQKQQHRAADRTQVTNHETGLQTEINNTGWCG